MEELRKTKKTSVRIISVPADVGTEHLLNISIDRYRYANPLGELWREDVDLLALTGSSPNIATGIRSKRIK
jgi:hypothetical protein